MSYRKLSTTTVIKFFCILGHTTLNCKNINLNREVWFKLKWHLTEDQDTKYTNATLKHEIRQFFVSILRTSQIFLLTNDAEINRSCTEWMMSDRDSVVGRSTRYRLHGPGTESRYSRDFPRPSTPAWRLAAGTMGTGSFPRLCHS